jgi:drug/metabolite transporter (DMT)-like permease
MANRKRRLIAEGLLASVTIFWGATFPIVKDAVTEVPVLSFLWVRFALSSVLLALLAGRSLGTLGRKGYQRGVFLGVLLFLSYLFQTLGLERTSAANCGFLTGLNIVWVPLLSGPLLKKHPGPGSKIGVAAALIGLFLLTWHTPWRLEPGDALVVVCSVFVALHILGLDALTAGYDGRALAFVQIATMAVLALASSLVFDPVTWPRTFSPGLIRAILICAVFATVYAFWIQTTFQRWTTPTRAALIYILEPVFAALFAYYLSDERLGTLGWVGGGFILLGMVAAELWPGPNAEGAFPPSPDGALMATAAEKQSSKESD